MLHTKPATARPAKKLTDAEQEAALDKFVEEAAADQKKPWPPKKG